MKNIRFGNIVLIFTHILKACRSAIVAVRNYHFVLYDESSDLSAFAIGILSPYLSHLKVSLVEDLLLVPVGSETICHFIEYYSSEGQSY